MFFTFDTLVAIVGALGTVMAVVVTARLNAANMRQVQEKAATDLIILVERRFTKLETEMGFVKAHLGIKQRSSD